MATPKKRPAAKTKRPAAKTARKAEVHAQALEAISKLLTQPSLTTNDATLIDSLSRLVATLK